MSNIEWQIPPSLLTHLARVPRDRAVVLLLRHSVRDPLPPNEVGDAVPLTEAGYRLACELGEQMQGRLRTLRSSPIPRCIQTAQALAKGARAELSIVPDRLLGAPGIYVLDGRQAWENWQRLGHEKVMHHQVTETTALSGMARPDEAARFLVNHMFAAAADQPGIHIFVTHDSLLLPTAARILGQALGVDDWPWFLEGACFWRDGADVCVAYRGHEACRAGSLGALQESDVIEFARREIAATVGLASDARFFLAGGAFKSLLTGLPPRDLDLWAPSARDRTLLIEALRSRGARPLEARPCADAFELADRVIEIPFKEEPPTLAERLARFDIALSAVGVEHRPGGQWSACIHPLASESVRRRQVLLLKPLVNWKYALATLERMRRYARELGFESPPEEECEVWQLFDAQPDEMRAGMVERYLRTSAGGFGIAEEIAAVMSKGAQRPVASPSRPFSS
jgi:broad specificity phosphatase PhoE